MAGLGLVTCPNWVLLYLIIMGPRTTEGCTMAGPRTVEDYALWWDHALKGTEL